MPKKDPYTCSVCKKLHIGANCWSEDSDEDIDSGLLQAMRTLVPREPPDVVDDPEVTPDQQSRPQSVSSTDSWERGDPSYVHEEHISTPPIHGQATPSSLSNRRGENKAFFVNTDVLDANEYRQQTLDTDIVGSQARIDSGIQERRRSDEYHMPSPRAYHFSQISALPQPLQLHDRQAQREHDGQYRRSGEYEQPDVQPRRSDEYERDQRIAREYSDTSGYLRRDEGDYQPQTARERGGRAQYQHPQQEDRMSPPPRREPQYPPRGSHDHPSKFRTSQEAMDEKAARQYGHGQSNSVNNPQVTPTSQRRFQREEIRYDQTQRREYGDRRNEHDRQRGEVQYHQPRRESNETPRPLGNLQLLYKKAREEEEAYNAAVRREHARKRHHGSHKRRDQEKTHRRPDPPRDHPTTPRRHEKTRVEEAASAAYHQRQLSNNSMKRREDENGPPHEHHDNLTTHHALTIPENNNNNNNQSPPSTLYTTLNPPGDLTHSFYKNVLPHPFLPETHFFRPQPTSTAEERRERDTRQTHWECALNRLEGRIGDGDVDGEWRRAFLGED